MITRVQSYGSTTFAGGISKKSLETAKNVLREIFPVTDPEYRNIFKVASEGDVFTQTKKVTTETCENPIRRYISVAGQQDEKKLKDKSVDEFINRKLP